MIEYRHGELYVYDGESQNFYPAVRPPRVLVCGGRDWTNAQAIHMHLGEIAGRYGWFTVITGDNPSGADAIANAWARGYFQGLVAVPAKWDVHGKAAGPIRNQLMLDGARPTQVLAFPSPARGLLKTGTGDMVGRAHKARLPIRIVFASGEVQDITPAQELDFD